MQLDPTRWLVSAAGFGTDWVISRDWSQIGVRLIPVAFLCFVASLVFMGSRLDTHRLANRYLEMGENEIADWEQAWIARPSDSKAAEQSPGGEQKSEAVQSRTEPAAKEPKKLSQFAEMLFRRVQLLEPNLRSQFIIGVTLSQRGAVGQALRMLSKIAPDERAGYEPAHAWLTEYLLAPYLAGKQLNADIYKVIKHHFLEAIKWDRVPESVLVNGSALLEQAGEFEPMMKATERLAEINPMKLSLLARRADLVNNVLVKDQAIEKGEGLFKSKLAEDPRNVEARFHFIELKLVEANVKKDEQSESALQRARERLQEAHQLADEALALEPSPVFVRVKSELFRFQFRLSFRNDNGELSADVQLLERAFKMDPSNPMVAEEIARLARANGPSPGAELIGVLQGFLAEGKATAVTHAWISELYLLRKEFAKALPHLEQVVIKMENAPQYMNNLAYVLSDLHPERIDEALKWSQQAVKLAPSMADYHDTMAKILRQMNRLPEAIVALETAIELQPTRTDFHENVSQLYTQTGNSGMADQHQKMIARLKQAQSQGAATPRNLAVEPVLPESPAANLPALPFDEKSASGNAENQDSATPR